VIDVGVPKDKVEEAFGALGVIKSIGKGVGGIAKVIKAFSREALGPDSLTSRASELGRGVRETAPLPKERDIGRQLGRGLGLPTAADAALADEVPSVDVEAVADASELPPVYVAEEDPSAVEGESAGGSLEDVEAFGGLSSCDRFGATAEYGFVKGQRRSPARTAASRALRIAERRMATARPGRPAMFVEDNDAEPVMYGDGAVYDAVYGRMCPVPCPSCSSLSERAAYGGASTECLVCSSFGAVLVPDGDLPNYQAGRYGFLFVPFLAAGAALSTPKGQAWAKKTAKKAASLFPESKKKLSKVEKQKKNDKAAELEAAKATEDGPTDDIDAELADLEQMGLVRAFAPSGIWTNRNR
jgi:hypothetical protein